MVFIHVVYGYMYDVNFPLLELGEAISFLFQRTLAFCWVSGKLFHFFGGEFGLLGGSSALRQTTTKYDYMDYEAFGRPLAADTGKGTRRYLEWEWCSGSMGAEPGRKV